ncbi:MAG: hypothetical protein ACRDTD_00980 [Pseudonocardiaceae bacterium]
MIFPFVELPRIPGGWPRPVLDVTVGNMGEVLMPCLVDSGAMNTLLPSWVADLAGIDYTDAAAKTLAVAGSSAKVRMVPTLLTIGDHSWEAEVGFCNPWPHGWGLLGQLSFFRYFVVTFQAADFELEINPVQR